MGKRKESGFDLLASMSWPVCLVLGMMGFIGIQYGIEWLWWSSSNPFLSGFAKAASIGVYTPIAWLALCACCLAAFASFLGRRKRRHLLESQTGMASLGSMDWRSFERLVGEAFRRQGYVVKETGQGGADGGIDLELSKGGQITLVQCKQWRWVASRLMPLRLLTASVSNWSMVMRCLLPSRASRRGRNPRALWTARCSSSAAY